ncbi:MAG: acetyl-CoA C-acyltransferase [Holophagales bacterium]|nr:acetyl-CoA C-acyltransferase [Holophagales bacterium]
MNAAASRPEGHLPGLPAVALIDACRTPFQRAGTGFCDLMSYQLAAATVRGLLERNGLAAEVVDRVVFGATVHNPRTTNVAREAALEAGIPATVPALTLTAAGASATVALATAADLVATGQAEVVIAGGTDCISDPPIGYSRAMRKKLLQGRRLRTVGEKLRFVAGLRPWDFLPDLPDVKEFTTGQTMGEYTEGLARRLGIGRKAQDAYAARSHQRAAAAASLLAEERVPVVVPELGVDVRDDNGIRPHTRVEKLASLRASFAADGTLTAGNSSYLTDGAAAVLLMSAERAEAEGLPVRAWLRANVLTAHDPADELLLGPVFAIPRALDAVGLELGEVEVIELHEAFAAQVLAVLELLASDDYARDHLGRERAVGRIDEDRLNAWGGSLAIGNPFAPNGARLAGTALHRLDHQGARHALVATCAGGALGQALVLERP